MSVKQACDNLKEIREAIDVIQDHILSLQQDIKKNTYEGNLSNRVWFTGQL